MTRAILWSALAALAASCGEEPETSPPPAQASAPAKVRIWGKVAVHADAAAWLAATGGQAPSLAGAKITVEEGLKATSGLPPLVTGVVEADSDYDFAAVDMTGVAIGIFSRLDDPPGAREDAIMATGTPLWRGRPPADIVGKTVLALPRTYVAALNDAITDEAGYLERQGFILGKVVDQSGAGVAGAKIHAYSGTVHSELTGVYYLDAGSDGTITATLDGVTGPSGLVLFVPAPPPAPAIREYTAVRGSDVFDKHLAGANAATAFCLTITKQ